MTDTVKVKLELAIDTPQSMTFADTMTGLSGVWYRFAADPAGNVQLWATPSGFEHLARYFLKLARTPKASGYHGHHTLEFGGGPPLGEPELTIGVVEHPFAGT